MRLREFGLYLPTASKEVRSAFQDQTRCVAALYERCFPRLDVDGGWKVLIECVPVVTRADVRNLGGVFTAQHRFDSDAFFRNPDKGDKKRMALEVLQAGVADVCSRQKWKKEPFSEAYRCVRENNYVNQWRWPKTSKWNPGRTHHASLTCDHDIDKVSSLDRCRRQAWR